MKKRTVNHHFLTYSNCDFNKEEATIVISHFFIVVFFLLKTYEGNISVGAKIHRLSHYFFCIKNPNWFEKLINTLFQITHLSKLFLQQIRWTDFPDLELLFSIATSYDNNPRTMFSASLTTLFCWQARKFKKIKSAVSMFEKSRCSLTKIN